LAELSAPCVPDFADPDVALAVLAPGRGARAVPCSSIPARIKMPAASTSMLSGTKMSAPPSTAKVLIVSLPPSISAFRGSISPPPRIAIALMVPTALDRAL
jgi:hypothetical protein